MTSLFELKASRNISQRASISNNANGFLKPNNPSSNSNLTRNIQQELWTVIPDNPIS